MLGPDTIPCVTDIDEALANPGAALLSAVVHAASEHAVAAAIAGMYGVANLAPDAQPNYNDLIVGLLSDRNKAQLETAMQQLNSRAPIPMTVPKDYKPGDFAREAGAEMERKRIRQTLRELLTKRGVALSEGDNNQIAQCADSGKLLGWLIAAATATDLAQVFTADTVR